MLNEGENQLEMFVRTACAEKKAGRSAQAIVGAARALTSEIFIERAKRHGMTYPRLRLALEGYLIHPLHFTKLDAVFQGDPLSVERKTKWDALSHLYRDGLVVVLDDVGEYMEEIRQIQTIVQSATGRITQANAYLTIGKKRGFSRHKDKEDIIVCQLYGSKTWQLGGREPYANETLHAGDALFVPSGLEHIVLPDASAAGHVSVALL